MSDFAYVAQFARELARESDRDVYVLPDWGGGWKFRHRDGTIPRPLLEDIAHRDAALNAPIDPTYESNGDGDLTSGSPEYRAYWSSYDG